MIYTSITPVLMAFSQCFVQFSTLMKSATDVFVQKNFPKVMLVASDRPGVARAIAPWVVLHLVLLLLLI